jgi:NarL family two-component system response regulator LiaR
MSELLNSLTTDMSIKEARRSKLESQLTGREQEIVKGVAQGLTNKEIGKWLNISEKTVKTHLSNIFDKLKVTRRLQLLQYAEQRPPKKNTSVAR